MAVRTNSTILAYLNVTLKNGVRANGDVFTHSYVITQDGGWVDHVATITMLDTEFCCHSFEIAYLVLMVLNDLFQ